MGQDKAEDVDRIVAQAPELWITEAVNDEEDR